VTETTSAQKLYSGRQKNLGTQSYDIVVVGAGVFGVWTAYELRRAGLRVALVEAYGPGHSRSSSGDESRIIRMSYGAEEIYTRWAWRSLTRWKEFEQTTGDALFIRTGVLLLANPGFEHTEASAAVLRRVGIPCETLERQELERRYPQFHFGEIPWGLYEPESGALLARKAVQSVARAALQAGVTYLREAVLPPTSPGTVHELATQSGTRLSAGQLIFTCGPWLPKLFPDLLAQRIHPTRQEVFYFGTPAGDAQFAPPHLPTWIDFSREFYGLPELEHRGFKVALDRHGAAFDPDQTDRQISAETLREVRSFLAERFPALAQAPLVENRVCQYENTCNGDFLIDRHPELLNVWLVGGGSGHGFKHGPALGEYVAAHVLSNDAVDARFSLATKETMRQRAVY